MDNDMSKKWFNAPVDVVGLKISSQYSATVTTPMDFGTISDKLQKGMYTSDNLFYADVVLVFENARDFSAKGATQAADVVQALFEKTYHETRRKIPVDELFINAVIRLVPKYLVDRAEAAAIESNGQGALRTPINESKLTKGKWETWRYNSEDWIIEPFSVELPPFFESGLQMFVVPCSLIGQALANQWTRGGE